MPDRRIAEDRRAASDRRGSDRRRNDGRQIAIELTTSEVRFAELQRAQAGGVDRVVAKVFPWRRDASTLHSPQGRAELAAAVRELARDRQLQGAEVRFILSGDYCIVRTVRGTFEEVRAELAELEERSRLYLALGPGEKVLVNHIRSLDARHAFALAAACNQGTLEAIQAATEAAGFEASVIEPSQAALCRTVHRVPDAPTDPCVVVHFDQDSFDIGVCHEGRLLLDYRPGGQARTSDAAALLESHLNRLSRHAYRLVRGGSQILETVFLCGDSSAIAEAAPKFKAHQKLTVRVIRPADIHADWQLAEDAADAATAPLLGGLLASLAVNHEPDSPNFMQHLRDRKRQPVRPVVVRSIVPIAAVLLAAIALGFVNRHERGALDAMRLELDGLAVAQGRATELRGELAASDAKLAQLEQLARQLPATFGGPAVQGIGSCLPNDVWLNKLEVVDGQSVRLSGASFQEAGVYDFVRWLQESPHVGEVALKGTNPGASPSGPVTDFELELRLGKVDAPSPKVACHE